MTIINVPITKGGKDAFVAVDTDKDIPDGVYEYVVMLGLKTLLNRGMAKVTKENLPDDAERQGEAMAIATKQLEALREGKVRMTGAKSKKASGAVMTEARRIAKGMIKDAIRAAGKKISHVEASEITKAANALLERDPSIVEKAKALLEERSKITVSEDLVAAIPMSEKLIAKAEKDKANKKEKAALSANAAGKTRKRAQQLNA